MESNVVLCELVLFGYKLHGEGFEGTHCALPRSRHFFLLGAGKRPRVKNKPWEQVSDKEEKEWEGLQLYARFTYWYEIFVPV